MAYVAGPFITPHLYIQWGGKLPGNEQWSCGLRMTPINVDPHPASDAATMQDAIASAIQGFHTATASQISNYCMLQFVKVNHIGIDGKYTESGTNEKIIADIGGGGVAIRYPNQVALVATTRTGFSRGPAHAGRFYIPMPSMVVAPDGLIGETDRNSVKTTANLLLTNLNAVNPTRYKVGVFSRKAGAPGQNLVTSIDIGRVLDTQRRRRRSLAEMY